MAIELQYGASDRKARAFTPKRAAPLIDWEQATINQREERKRKRRELKFKIHELLRAQHELYTNADLTLKPSLELNQLLGSNDKTDAPVSQSEILDALNVYVNDYLATFPKNVINKNIYDDFLTLQSSLNATTANGNVPFISILDDWKETLRSKKGSEYTDSRIDGLKQLDAPQSILMYQDIIKKLPTIPAQNFSDIKVMKKSSDRRFALTPAAVDAFSLIVGRDPKSSAAEDQIKLNAIKIAFEANITDKPVVHIRAVDKTYKVNDLSKDPGSTKIVHRLEMKSIPSIPLRVLYPRIKPAGEVQVIACQDEAGKYAQQLEEVGIVASIIALPDGRRLEISYNILPGFPIGFNADGTAIVNEGATAVRIPDNDVTMINYYKNKILPIIARACASDEPGNEDPEMLNANEVEAYVKPDVRKSIEDDVAQAKKIAGEVDEEYFELMETSLNEAKDINAEKIPKKHVASKMAAAQEDSQKIADYIKRIKDGRESFRMTDENGDEISADKRNDILDTLSEELVSKKDRIDGYVVKFEEQATINKTLLKLADLDKKINNIAKLRASIESSDDWKHDETFIPERLSVYQSAMDALTSDVQACEKIGDNPCGVKFQELDAKLLNEEILHKNAVALKIIDEVRNSLLNIERSVPRDGANQLKDIYRAEPSLHAMIALHGQAEKYIADKRIENTSDTEDRVSQLKDIIGDIEQAFNELKSEILAYHTDKIQNSTSLVKDADASVREHNRISQIKMPGSIREVASIVQSVRPAVDKATRALYGIAENNALLKQVMINAGFEEAKRTSAHPQLVKDLFEHLQSVCTMSDIEAINASPVEWDRLKITLGKVFADSIYEENNFYLFTTRVDNLRSTFESMDSAQPISKQLKSLTELIGYDDLSKRNALNVAKDVKKYAQKVPPQAGLIYLARQAVFLGPIGKNTAGQIEALHAEILQKAVDINEALLLTDLSIPGAPATGLDGLKTATENMAAFEENYQSACAFIQSAYNQLTFTHPELKRMQVSVWPSSGSPQEAVLAEVLRNPKYSQDKNNEILLSLMTQRTALSNKFAQAKAVLNQNIANIQSRESELLQKMNPGYVRFVSQQEISEPLAGDFLMLGKGVTVKSLIEGLKLELTDEQHQFFTKTLTQALSQPKDKVSTQVITALYGEKLDKTLNQRFGIDTASMPVSRTFVRALTLSVLAEALVEECDRCFSQPRDLSKRFGYNSFVTALNWLDDQTLTMMAKSVVNQRPQGKVENQDSYSALLNFKAAVERVNKTSHAQGRNIDFDFSNFESFLTSESLVGTSAEIRQSGDNGQYEVMREKLNINKSVLELFASHKPLARAQATDRISAKALLTIVNDLLKPKTVFEKRAIAQYVDDIYNSTNPEDTEMTVRLIAASNGKSEYKTEVFKAFIELTNENASASHPQQIAARLAYERLIESDEEYKDLPVYAREIVKNFIDAMKETAKEFGITPEALDYEALLHKNIALVDVVNDPSNPDFDMEQLLALLASDPQQLKKIVSDKVFKILALKAGEKTEFVKEWVDSFDEGAEELIRQIFKTSQLNDSLVKNKSLFGNSAPDKVRAQSVIDSLETLAQSIPAKFRNDTVENLINDRPAELRKQFSIPKQTPAIKITTATRKESRAKLLVVLEGVEISEKSLNKAITDITPEQINALRYAYDTHVARTSGTKNFERFRTESDYDSNIAALNALKKTNMSEISDLLERRIDALEKEKSNIFSDKASTTTSRGTSPILVAPAGLGSAKSDSSANSTGSGSGTNGQEIIDFKQVSERDVARTQLAKILWPSIFDKVDKQIVNAIIPDHADGASHTDLFKKIDDAFDTRVKRLAHKTVLNYSDDITSLNQLKISSPATDVENAFNARIDSRIAKLTQDSDKISQSLLKSSNTPTYFWSRPVAAQPAEQSLLDRINALEVTKVFQPDDVKAIRDNLSVKDRGVFNDTLRKFLDQQKYHPQDETQQILPDLAKIWRNYVTGKTSVTQEEMSELLVSLAIKIGPSIKASSEDPLGRKYALALVHGLAYLQLRTNEENLTQYMSKLTSVETNELLFPIPKQKEKQSPQ